MAVHDQSLHPRVRSVTPPVEVFAAELQAWADDLAGPVAVELLNVALDVVIPQAVESISPRAELTLGGPNNTWHIWSPNEDKVPRQRSGDMIANLAITGAMLDTEHGGLVVYGVSDAEHDGRNYWIILRDGLNPNIEGNYRFFKNNPFYTYDGIAS